MSFGSHGSKASKRRRGLAALSICALAAWCALVSAQQDPQQQPPPVFRSTVQLIEVDVRVFDKDGRFVADLTQDDFEIVEDGVAQSVRAIYLVGPGAPRSMPPLPDAGGLLPGTRGAERSAAQTWVFVFDLNHLVPGSGFDRARKAVERFIRDRFKEGDIAGIVAGDRMVNNRLTSVRQELLDAVMQVKPRDDRRRQALELTREWPRLLDEMEAIAVARSEREAIARAVQRACFDDNTQCNVADAAVREKGQRMAGEIHRSTLATLSTINTLASGLARVPGPKTVVLLSDGFVVQNIETSLRSVAGQATRAGARVYGIDVRGLNRGGLTIEQPHAMDEASPSARVDGLADGPNSLAVDTGGLMIRNENDLGRALATIAEDAGRYYVLAYQPPNPTLDGKYRAIEVRVKRDGLRVRARRGYLALDPSRLLEPTPLTTPAPAAGVTAPSTRVEGKPVEPDEEPRPLPPAPVPVATGPPVGELTTEVAGAVRLRPDSVERVKALSERDGAAARTDHATRGWAAYERGDVETALADLSEAARAPDVRPWVLYALGMTQAGLGRPLDAIASWERVRAAVPDFDPVYMDLADTYAHVGDLTRALATVREAEKRWPKNANVQSAIGVIHVRRGAIDEGLRALETAVELDPSDALAHLNVARAYALKFHQGRRYVTSQRRWVASEGDRQKAIEAFRRCIALGGPYAQQARSELNLLEWSK